MSNNGSFTQGKILSPLIRFSIPILFAMILQAMYGAVDLLIVGQFGTAADVSAVSTGSQIMQTITCVVTGLAMGTTILLGQKIGQNKQDEAGNVIGGAICLFTALAIIITIIMIFAAKPFSALMRAPIEAFDKTVSYVLICSLGSICIIAYNVLGSIFRGMGNSKTPLFTVFVACIVNIFGDLLFVAVFKMEAAGAALATVIAQAVSVFLGILVIKKEGLPFSFSRKNIYFNKQIILDNIKLGAPIALQDGLVSISFLAILAIVNSLGLIESAGVGVAEKLCMFIMLIPSSFMQALSAFVAQNIGAGQYDRAQKSMLYAMLTSLSFGIIVSYASFFHGDVLASIFSKDTQVILAAADYLKAYAIDTIFVSFLFCYIGYFNGYGKTTFVMIQGIVGAFLVRIPFSYFMSKAAEVSLFKVGLATPASTLVQITLCTIYLIYTNKQLSNTEKVLK